MEFITDSIINKGADFSVFKCLIKTPQNPSGKYYAVKTGKLKNYNPIIERYFLKLNHKNLEDILFVLKDKKNVFIISEILHKDLYFYNPKEDKSIEQIGLDIINGLEYLHSLNIVHADLKQNNIMIDFQHNARIIDLNNCISVEKKNKIILPITLARMPHALFFNPYKWDFFIDIWAVGAILYYLFTKQELISQFLLQYKLTDKDDDFIINKYKNKLKLYYDIKIATLKTTNEFVYFFFISKNLFELKNFLKNKNELN